MKVLLSRTDVNNANVLSMIASIAVNGIRFASGDITVNARNPIQKHVEETYIRQAAQGDLEAFNPLVLAYQNLAYNHAYTLLGDPAEAADAAQESFIRAYQNIAGFRGGSFRAWLLKIVTNTALDNLRRSRRHPSQSLYLEDEAGEEIESPTWLCDPAPSVQAIVEQNELSRHIFTILDELPEIYRSVLTLVDIDEFDYLEAAQALNIPIGTVKSRLARARLQVAEKLNQNYSVSASAAVQKESLVTSA